MPEKPSARLRREIAEKEQAKTAPIRSRRSPTSRDFAIMRESAAARARHRALDAEFEQTLTRDV